MKDYWVVYTEIHKETGIERWFYGLWKDRDQANEAALDLDGHWPVYYCVCREDEAKELGIQNMPR